MPTLCGSVATPVRKTRNDYSKARNWSGDRGHTTFRHVLGLVACPDSGMTKPSGNETLSNYQSMNQVTRGPCTVPNRDKSKPPRTERDPDRFKTLSQSSPGKNTLMNPKDARRIEVHRIAAAYNGSKSQFDAISSRSRFSPDRNTTARESRTVRESMKRSGIGGGGGGSGGGSGMMGSGGGGGGSGAGFTGRMETGRSTARSTSRNTARSMQR